MADTTSDRPAYQLSEHHTQRILAGLVGSLYALAGEELLKRELRWLLENDEWWLNVADLHERFHL